MGPRSYRDFEYSHQYSKGCCNTQSGSLPRHKDVPGVGDTVDGGNGETGIEDGRKDSERREVVVTGGTTRTL